MLATKDKIWFTFQKEGIHRYPAAETAPELEGVRFLAHPHRHIFHFRVDLQVFHDDRDVEFILAKRWAESLYAEGVMEIDFKSCEMLARELLTKINERWPNRDISVSVSEDDENGAVLEYKHNA